MNPDQQDRLDQLFGRAIELPEDERSEFVRQVVDGDAKLGRVLTALLAADAESTDFLARPAVVEFEHAPGVPRQIGPYRLLHQIGEGGMSTVWLAVRDEPPLQRRAAVKLLRHGMASPQQVRRLQAEAQILGGLDHPGIAHVYDAGATPEELPYVIMEYIEGEPIDVYCDRHQLSVERRLELFRQVCAAVHYAHQNLVVHRDIKPRNILVNEDGQARLVDFGIAKLLNPGLSPGGPDPTIEGQQLFTPEYASLEQIRGQPATTEADVYALGVLLYVLLAGRKPHRLHELTPGEILRTLREEQPQPPSAAAEAKASAHRRLSPKGLRRRLQGDLDSIVFTAMDKSPHRRYGSAEQLSEDVRRHLAGMPVEARGDAFAYRAGKLLRRHRLPAALAACGLILILAIASGLAVQSARLAAERDRAENERDKAARVTNFLEGIFQSSDPNVSRGDTITARQLLDRGALRVEAELAGQAELQALLMAKIGDLYRKLGHYEAADRLLSNALERRREVFGENSLPVAEGLTLLGLLRHEQGEYPSAEELHQRALQVRRQIHPAEHPEIAQSFAHLATVLAARGQAERAESLARQALDMRRRLYGREHPEVAAGLAQLGGLLWRKGELERAKTLLGEALAMRRLLYGDVHLEVAESSSQLARVLQERQLHREAEQLVSSALETWRRLLGEDHPRWIEGLSQLADLSIDQSDLNRASELYREALDRAQQNLGSEHPKLAAMQEGFASWNLIRGLPIVAEEFSRRALAIYRRTLPEHHRTIALCRWLLGTSLVRQRRFVEGEDLLLSSYDDLSADPSTRQDELRRLNFQLLGTYLSWQRLEPARAIFERVSGRPAPPGGLDELAASTDLLEFEPPGPSVGPRSQPGEPTFLDSECLSVNDLLIDLGLDEASCNTYCASQGKSCSNTCISNRGYVNRGAEAWLTEAQCRTYTESGGQVRCQQRLDAYPSHFRRKYRCCCIEG